MPGSIRRGWWMDATAIEVALPHAAEAAPQARHVVREALADHPARADAELVATELVTNAVLPGAPPVLLRVRRETERIRVEVSDHGHGVLLSSPRGSEAMTGRG